MFYIILLVSDKTQKSAYLLGSTADFRRLSLLFVQDKFPLRFTTVFPVPIGIYTITDLYERHAVSIRSFISVSQKWYLENIG